MYRKLKAYVLWRKKNPWYVPYANARERCKPTQPYGKKGIQFEMTIEDFKMLWFRDKAYLMKQPSIDRKKTTADYTVNNCHFIEFKDNLKKKKHSGWDIHGTCKACKSNRLKYIAHGLCASCYSSVRYHKEHKEARYISTHNGSHGQMVRSTA